MARFKFPPAAMKAAAREEVGEPKLSPKANAREEAAEMRFKKKKGK